ncbi:MAG: hypothetical protein GXY74_15860 [Phycisphaerae bacterium]|nr:hypothetical protein [Phycisphaerae bacterium]
MKRIMITAALVSAAAVLGVLPLQARSPKDEWQSGWTLKQHLDTAAAKDVPVAVIYQMEHSSCPIHDARVASYETLQELEGMLKVRVFVDSNPEGFKDMRRGAYHYFVPVLYIADGEGHLVGYAAEETPFTDLRETAKQAAKAMLWKKKTRATLAAIDKQIEARQLIPARKQLDQVIKQDLALAQAVRTSITAANHLALATYARKKQLTAEQAAAKAKPYLAEATEGLFFAAATQERAARIDSLLTEKLAEIEAAVAAGDPTKAARALAPLMKASFGPDGDAKVKALDERIRAALKEAVANKKAADTAPAPPQ